MQLKTISLLFFLLLFINCGGGSNTQYPQLVKLPSGKEIKATGLQRMNLYTGEVAVVFNYETNIPIENKEVLRQEINEVWSVFQKEAEAGQFKRAVIHPTYVEGGVSTGKSYRFVFSKRGDGKWHLSDDDKK